MNKKKHMFSLGCILYSFMSTYSYGQGSGDEFERKSSQSIAKRVAENASSQEREAQSGRKRIKARDPDDLTSQEAASACSDDKENHAQDSGKRGFLNPEDRAAYLQEIEGRKSWRKLPDGIGPAFIPEDDQTLTTAYQSLPPHPEGGE